ncbi:MAG: UPF0179 family protein [Candidatus Methanomethylophilaceae archaeon]|nr:UPF0179 family protein [Candidatus Methanomethylophilaceae archaeon]
MVLITLLGEPQAEAGKEFYFIGPMNDCKECKLKGVCFNLEPGSRYKVVEIRPQSHECHEYLDDKVVAAVVEKIPTPAAVPKKQAIEGSMITYQESKCEQMDCPNYWLCHAPGKVAGAKYSVQAVSGDLDCPRGEKMVGVDLFRGRSAPNVFRTSPRLSSRTCPRTAC